MGQLLKTPQGRRPAFNALHVGAWRFSDVPRGKLDAVLS
jgi:hypothetical protein